MTVRTEFPRPIRRIDDVWTRYDLEAAADRLRGSAPPAASSPLLPPQLRPRPGGARPAPVKDRRMTATAAFPVDPALDPDDGDDRVLACTPTCPRDGV